jgi:hypothetical protein
MRPSHYYKTIDLLAQVQLDMVQLFKKSTTYHQKLKKLGKQQDTGKTQIDSLL